MAFLPGSKVTLASPAQKLSFLPFRKMRTLFALSPNTSFPLLAISQKWSAMLLWFTCASFLSLRQNDFFFFFNSLLISILLPGVSNCQAGLQPAQGWMLERSQLFILYPLPPREHVSFSVLLKMWDCCTVWFCLRHLCKPQLTLGVRPVLETSPQALTVSSF